MKTNSNFSTENHEKPVLLNQGVSVKKLENMSQWKYLFGAPEVAVGWDTKYNKGEFTQESLDVEYIYTWFSDYPNVDPDYLKVQFIFRKQGLTVRTWVYKNHSIEDVIEFDPFNYKGREDRHLTISPAKVALRLGLSFIEPLRYNQVFHEKLLRPTIKQALKEAKQDHGKLLHGYNEYLCKALKYWQSKKS